MVQRSKWYCEPEMLSFLEVCEKWPRQTDCCSPLKMPHHCGHANACFCRTCPFKASCVTCILITGSDFSISHFLICRHEEDSQGRARNHNALLSGNRINLLKWWYRDPGRIMLYLAWIFIWFVARERIEGFNISGRSFLFSRWCYKSWGQSLKWQMIWCISSMWYINTEHFLPTVKV